MKIIERIKESIKALFLAAWDDRVIYNILFIVLLLVCCGLTLFGFFKTNEFLFYIIFLTIALSCLSFFASKIIYKLSLIFWISEYSTKLLFIFIFASMIFIAFVFFEIYAPDLIDRYVNEVVQGKIDEFLIGIIIGFVVAYLTDKLITKFLFKLEYNKELQKLKDALEMNIHNEEQVKAVMAKIESLVKKSHSESQYYLGMIYLDGKKIIPKDIKRATELLQQAAERKHKEAIIALGEMRYEEQDHKKALKWYKKVAKQGNVKAQFNLGFAYYEGLGVWKSYKKAFKFFIQAANQGHAGAQYYLGKMYEKGRGVRKNIEEAKRYYSMATEQDYPGAEFALGIIQ